MTAIITGSLPKKNKWNSTQLQRKLRFFLLGLKTTNSFLRLAAAQRPILSAAQKYESFLPYVELIIEIKRKPITLCHCCLFVVLENLLLTGWFHKEKQFKCISSLCKLSGLHITFARRTISQKYNYVWRCEKHALHAKGNTLWLYYCFKSDNYRFYFG